MNSYEIIKIDNSTWRVEDNGVRFFLLSGDDYSLLIDIVCEECHCLRNPLRYYNFF